MVYRKHIDVLYIHPNPTDFNVPLGAIGLMNSIDCPKLGTFCFETTEDLVLKSKIVVMDCHWFFPLHEVGTLSRQLKSINPRVIIIVGGYTATIFAEDIVKRFPVDFVIRGDAEGPFPLLINALLSGRSYGDIPNIVSRGHRSPHSYSLTEDEFNNTDYLTIDWFPSLKKRMSFLNAAFPQGFYNETFGVYPIITAFKGCPYDICDFCYGCRELQQALCKRGTVAREASAVIRDLQRCSRSKDINQVYMLSDFIPVLGAEYAKEVFSQKYDLNLHYEFSFKNTLTLDVLDRMLQSFNRCRFTFLFSDLYHKHSHRARFNYLAKIFEFIKKRSSSTILELYGLKGNEVFNDYYTKLSRMHEDVRMLDHGPWMTDIPYPNTGKKSRKKNSFTHWIGKSQKEVRKRFIASSAKHERCRFYCILGREYFKRGNFKKAQYYCKRASYTNYGDPNLNLFLTKLYLDMERYDNALEESRRLRRSPHSAQLKILSACCYAKKGEHRKAIRQLNRIPKQRCDKNQKDDIGAMLAICHNALHAHS